MSKFVVSCETDDEEIADVVKQFMNSINGLSVVRYCENVPKAPKPIKEYLIEYQVLVTYEAKVDATSEDEAVKKWKEGDCDDSEETEASWPVVTKITKLNR